MTWTTRKADFRRIVASTLGNAASPLLSVAEPFTFTEGQTLTVDVDGTQRTITLSAMVAATAVEVATVLGAGFDTYGSKVRLSSSRYCGPDSRVQILDGDANAVLQFSTDLSQGGGLADRMVTWANESRPNVVFQEMGRLSLDVVADRPVGAAEVRKSVGPVLTVIQQHILTLQIQAECLSHLGSHWAFRWLTDIQNNISREVTKGALRLANMSIAGVGDALRLPGFIVDDREYSRANLDLRIAYLDETADASFDGGWIETVEVTSPFLTDETNPLVIP